MKTAGHVAIKGVMKAFIIAVVEIIRNGWWSHKGHFSAARAKGNVTGDTCYSCFLLTMACPLLDDVLDEEAIILRRAWRKENIFRHRPIGLCRWTSDSEVQTLRRLNLIFTQDTGLWTSGESSRIRFGGACFTVDSRWNIHRTRYTMQIWQFLSIYYLF